MPRFPSVSGTSARPRTPIPHNGPSGVGPRVRFAQARRVPRRLEGCSRSMIPRTIAVDWSGAKEPLKNLWLAEAVPGELLEVRRFNRRDQLVTHLIGALETGS